MSPAATHKRRLQILQVSLNNARLSSVGLLAFVSLLQGTWITFASHHPAEALPQCDQVLSFAKED